MDTTEKYNSAYTGQQIDETVAKLIDGLTIPSSTENSTKQFKLRADDDGRLIMEVIAE